MRKKHPASCRAGGVEATQAGFSFKRRTLMHTGLWLARFSRGCFFLSRAIVSRWGSLSLPGSCNWVPVDPICTNSFSLLDLLTFSFLLSWERHLAINYPSLLVLQMKKGDTQDKWCAFPKAETEMESGTPAFWIPQWCLRLSDIQGVGEKNQEFEF